jgi:hypothetical protein
MSTATLHRAPADPRPLAPLHAAIVDGAHFTLAWEPVEDARRYRVQIARTPSFDTTVFERDVAGDAVALALWYAHPGDDESFFWRVLAEDEVGWSPGERIESLITGTAGEVGLFADPDGSEPFGPVASLFSAAAMQTYGSGRQRGTDAPAGGIRSSLERFELFSLGVLVAVAAAIIVAAVLFFALTVFAT